MRHIRLQFEDECYPVWIGIRCVDEIVSNLRELGASSYHVISDRTVSQLHAGILCEQLSAQASARLWVVDNGESCKSLGTVEHLAQKMVQVGIDRGSVIVAVGGGVIGNLAGLIAALLFRGIRLVHVPTTLIAAADSVASLKQAVNLSLGKNLLGCFHKPTAVLIDLEFLRTLPATQIRSGMYEIIKNALTVATENIPLLESGLKADANYSELELMTIVEAGLLAKQKVMKDDKCERKEALVFEYGHTVGHAIELAAEGRIPHGEAVGLGMIVAAEVASRLGRLSEADRSLHHHLLSRNGLTFRLPAGVTVAAVMALLRTDNKRGYVCARPDQVVMILLDGLGVPAGTAGSPLIRVDASLIQSCIEDCLTGIKKIAAEESRQ
ncbi:MULTISPECIES: 2-deoxy-scyllo-inosose synthase [unclassified Pseudomonas]|uniref:2-deoxy-scyllo-inosose synthase n=1 Tax=unclassified Pseudomonas TaxID=196821 RepID=UPI0021C7A69C|nr:MULTISPECIES: 2-deoxy-scyllo-inosose synthase [unclassified Pseudomonas]MCU1730125.1 2-deoxy-scyllo-inosose synthase [Pseudomonas sp. 20P_3.2_Bac4]MCU1747560.1 2-deoxy-scyllo-inosose synthase [Pseudomonas sp. 20P_3.2_Bac5]